MTWQSIETAPKTGVDLVMHDGFAPFVGCWRNENGRTGWGIHTDCTTLWAGEQPLYWMPIPELPSKTSGEK